MSIRWASPGRLPWVSLVGIVLVWTLLAGAFAAVPSRVAAGDPPALRVAVSGSPFRGTAPRPRVTLIATLGRPARLTIKVLDFGGHVLRTLLDAGRDAGDTTLTWDGRTARGRVAPDGAYRLRVTAASASGTTTRTLWVTKAPGVPYPAAPGSIVVDINPGHGGSDPGAVVRQTRESDLNLDIARRLRAMLEGAGVTVVMTRTTDRDVNRPAIDRNGDHRVNHADELQARNDVANSARADVAINIHNNAAACRCGQGTEVFLNRHRPWAAQNVRLGSGVLHGIIGRLRAFQSRTWRVHDRGLGPGDYVALHGATRTSPRPALMPAILGESLYLDRRAELDRLRDPAVRSAIAAGYFDGITRYLAGRTYGVRYTAIEAPATLPVRGRATVRVHVQDTGNVASSGWRLEARLVPRVPFYDGSGRRGLLVGSVRVPDGIAPGEGRDLELPVMMPGSVGRWLLKLDIVRASLRLSDRGVVQAQRAITTVTAGTDSAPAP